MSREIGWMVVDMTEPEAASLDWLGPAVSKDRAIDLLARYGQEWPELDWVLARVVVEEDE